MTPITKSKLLCSIGGILFGAGMVGIIQPEMKHFVTKTEADFRESAALHQGYWSGVKAAFDNVKVISSNGVCRMEVEMETLNNIDNHLTNETTTNRTISIP